MIRVGVVAGGSDLDGRVEGALCPYQSPFENSGTKSYVEKSDPGGGLKGWGGTYSKFRYPSLTLCNLDSTNKRN